MKRMLIWFLLTIMLCTSAFALAPLATPQQIQVREKLADMGYPVSDEVFSAAIEELYSYQEMIKEFEGLADLEDFYSETLTDEYFAYILLMTEGMGQYDEETWEWTPSSGYIYVFDAEFMNIDMMYTEFLLGVKAIVPDAQFENVQEDLSGMSIEWDPEIFSDGTRSVSFTCNGHPYAITLDSYGDWLNDEIIDFVNDVLKTEGCAGRLHAINDYQTVFLIYGTDTQAAELRQVMGFEPVIEMPDMEDQPLLTQKLVDFFF